jgi:hypothetical protein
VKVICNGDPLSLSSLQDGLNKYMEHVQFRGLLTKYWSIWLPVQCLTFSVVPAQYRVVFVAAISFLWVILLSAISASSTSPSSTTSTADNLQSTININMNPNDTNTDG